MHEKSTNTDFDGLFPADQNLQLWIIFPHVTVPDFPMLFPTTNPGILQQIMLFSWYFSHEIPQSLKTWPFQKKTQGTAGHEVLVGLIDAELPGTHLIKMFATKIMIIMILW